MIDAERVLGTFTRWLEDGDSWIGVFENKDLGSHLVGHRVAFCFADSDWDEAKVGVSQCPDHPSIGLGWRYRLIEKTRDAHVALDAVLGDVEIR